MCHPTVHAWPSMVPLQGRRRRRGTWSGAAHFWGGRRRASRGRSLGAGPAANSHPCLMAATLLALASELHPQRRRRLAVPGLAEAPTALYVACVAAAAGPWPPRKEVGGGAVLWTVCLCVGVRKAPSPQLPAHQAWRGVQLRGGCLRYWGCSLDCGALPLLRPPSTAPYCSVPDAMLWLC